MRTEYFEKIRQGLVGCIAFFLFVISASSAYAASGDACKALGGQCKLVGGANGQVSDCADVLQYSVSLGPSDCPQSGYEELCCKTLEKSEPESAGPVSNTPGAAAKLSVAANYGYVDPMGGLTIPGVVARIISNVLPIIGALFLAFFIWGGTQYLTAGGDDTKVKKARQTLLNAAIGMMIVMGAYAIVYNIISIFGKSIGQ